MTDPSVETLSSDDRPERVPRQRGNGFRRRSLLAVAGNQATALGAVVSLVLAGGVATAAYRSLQSEPDAATRLPSTAFAAAVFHLDDAGSLAAFADRFPGSPTRQGPGSAVDRLLRAMTKDSSNPHIDYDHDISPWLGDQAAVVAWLDGSAPKVAVVLKSTNDTLARTRLGVVQASNSDLGSSIDNGWVTLAANGDDARAAVEAAQRAPLSGNQTYADDVAALPSGEAAVGWVNGPGLKRAMTTMLGGVGGGLPGSGLDLGSVGLFGVGVGGNSKAMFDQRTAVGLRLTGDYAQVDATVVGMKNSPPAPATMLTHLPSGTIGAVELTQPGEVVTAATRALNMFLLPTTFSCGAAFGTAPAPALPSVQVPAGTPHRKRVLRSMRRFRAQLRRQERNAEKQFRTRSPLCSDAPPPDPLARVTSYTGLTLPDDAATLLGDRAVVSYGGLNIGALPDIAIRSHPTNRTDARALADRLSSTVAAHSPVRIAVDDAGSDLVLGTSSTYAHAIVTGGDLGGQHRFASALAGMPAQVNIAGYVDFTRIWPTAGVPASAGVRHLEALGFWAAQSGDRMHEQLRLLVN
ncbi:MAG: DUF3352 domain-containing protein [Frankiales bacterium]|nr:DUF3352 domain-containing protein [Frankiales bacterium]